MNKDLSKRYIIRAVADTFWLLDLDMKNHYTPPLQLNETGADMARLIIKELDDEAIAELLSQELEVEKDELLEDVSEFRKTLALGQ